MLELDCMMIRNLAVYQVFANALHDSWGGQPGVMVRLQLATPQHRIQNWLDPSTDTSAWGDSITLRITVYSVLIPLLPNEKCAFRVCCVIFPHSVTHYSNVHTGE